MAQSFREMMTSPRKRPMNGACGTLEPNYSDAGAPIGQFRQGRCKCNGSGISSSGNLVSEMHLPYHSTLTVLTRFMGVQTPKIQCSIGYRPSLPNNIQSIILG